MFNDNIYAVLSRCFMASLLRTEAPTLWLDLMERQIEIQNSRAVLKKKKVMNYRTLGFVR